MMGTKSNRIDDVAMAQTECLRSLDGLDVVLLTAIDIGMLTVIDWFGMVMLTVIDWFDVVTLIVIGFAIYVYTKVLKNISYNDVHND